MATKIVCYGFLIPDRYSLYKDLPEHVQEHYGPAYTEMLGREPESNDIMVGLWQTGEGKPDMNDQPFTTKSLGGYKTTLPSWYPAGIFSDSKEGDQVTVKFHLKTHKFEPEYTQKVFEVELTTLLAQTKYRYSRYGKFEEVLSGMIAAATGRA